MSVMNKSKIGGISYWFIWHLWSLSLVTIIIWLLFLMLLFFLLLQLFTFIVNKNKKNLFIVFLFAYSISDLMVFIVDYIPYGCIII